MHTESFDLMTMTTLLLLMVIAPLLGVWDWHRLVRWTEERRADARLKTYNWILIMEWGMTLALVGWWLGAGRDLATLGLVPAAAGWQWLALGLGMAGLLFIIWQMISVLRSPEKLEQVREEAAELGILAPQSPAEDRRFAMVAVTAGICEEVLYRGLLLTMLVTLVGTWPAVLLTSIIFGLGHAYQGLTGIIKTGLIGVVMALLAVFSGSLFIGIVLHAAVDLASGRMMGRALRAHPQDAAATEPT